MSEILIVEDDNINYELASELLEYAGHNVKRAENYDQCMLSIKKQKPDLILMDINLPEVKGTNITKIIKNNDDTKDIKIVAFTAMVMEKDKKEAFDAGCSGFISKPFSINSFVSTVEGFIQNNRNNTTPTKKKESFYAEKFPEKKEDYNKEFIYSSHNVLVVDDNPLNTDILKETLEQLGQEVLVANSGKKAFELIKKNRVDLVLLDIMMPDMNGFDIIRQFKLNPETSDLPVIFVSALDKTSDIVKGFNLGSCEYIVKPYKIEELKARVLSILKIKDLQDKLKSEKKILDLIFQFSDDVIILLNSEFEIISCNEMFLKWAESRKEEIIHKKLHQIFELEPKEPFFPFEKNYSHFDFKIQTGTKKRYVEASCSKISESDEQTEEGYIMVLRDVSVKREIEAQKETFVATLTHDLKTPVRAQTKALEMILDEKFGQLKDSQEEIIRETLNSNKYMACMLDNLLSTYRLENGNTVFKKQNTDINNIISSCCSELKYLANDKGHEVILDFNHAESIAMVDPLEIKRVFINLISNAFNYTDENGSIIISSKKENNAVIVSVKDNGRGMTEKEISVLFNKYTSYSRKFRHVGTGLGLYLSKKIIESHGGKIIVESKEGQGSCFTVYLPVEKTEKVFSL